MKPHLGAAFLIGVMLMNASSARGDETPIGPQTEEHLDTGEDYTLSYLLSLPADYDEDETKDWPLLLFLHGRGESHGPLSLVAKWGPPRMIARGDALPYIVVSPQCPKEARWTDEREQAAVVSLLDHIAQKYRVDNDRVYLTGLSLGGYGSWRLAADHPERFAAVAPVCGGGKPEDAERLKSLPIWVFHGDADRAVPFRLSEAMVEAIRAAGGEKILFTSMEGVGHNCWSAAYATPQLYSWFDKQTASQNQADAN